MKGSFAIDVLLALILLLYFLSAVPGSSFDVKKLICQAVGNIFNNGVDIVYSSGATPKIYSEAGSITVYNDAVYIGGVKCG